MWTVKELWTNKRPVMWIKQTNILEQILKHIFYLSSISQYSWNNCFYSNFIYCSPELEGLKFEMYESESSFDEKTEDPFGERLCFEKSKLFRSRYIYTVKGIDSSFLPFLFWVWRDFDFQKEWEALYDIVNKWFELLNISDIVAVWNERIKELWKRNKWKTACTDHRNSQTTGAHRRHTPTAKPASLSDNHLSRGGPWGFLFWKRELGTGREKHYTEIKTKELNIFSK